MPQPNPILWRQPLALIPRPLLAVLFLFAALLTTAAAEPTNYFCIVCGKGPLTGHIWLHPRGAICDDCEKIQERCTLCGLPVKAGDGHLKTSDGRFICKFDKADAVMTQDQARELFDQTRDAVVALYGREFELKYHDVTVTLFDVDYWSEKGQANGLHKFGFASTRKTGTGECTHEVVMLSGRTRQEMMGVAAHEYTHLWINENCPASHHIDGDTVEAICELTAYKLMQQKKLPALQKHILENPYTNGKIKDLLAVEREGGTDYVLKWVKTSQAETFDVSANLPLLAAPAAPAPLVLAPRVLPRGLKFSGLMSFGKEQTAVINGEEFAAGDRKSLKLRDRQAQVRCVEIQEGQITVEVDGKTLTLERGEEKMLP